jgi:excisionase family DNA binding protein
MKTTLEDIKNNFQPKEPEEYLTSKEVQKLLGCCNTTLFNWRNNGVLNAYGIGDKVFFKRSDINKALTKLK